MLEANKRRCKAPLRIGLTRHTFPGISQRIFAKRIRYAFAQMRELVRLALYSRSACYFLAAKVLAKCGWDASAESDKMLSMLKYIYTALESTNIKI